jgi:hypothetical protein
MDASFDDAMMRDANPTSRFVVGSDRPKTLQDYVDTGAISPAKAETIRTTRGASSPVDAFGTRRYRGVKGNETVMRPTQGAPVSGELRPYLNKPVRTTRGASSPVDAMDKPLYTSPIYGDANANPLQGPWQTVEDYKTQGINRGRRDYYERLARGEQPIQTRVRGASSPIDITPSTSSTRSIDSLRSMTNRKPNRDNALLGRLMDNKPVRGTYSQEVNNHLLGNLLNKPSLNESIMERVGRRASSGLEHVGSSINKLPRWAKIGAALAAGAGMYQLGRMSKSMEKRASKPVLKTMSMPLSTSTNKSMLKSKHNNKYL